MLRCSTFLGFKHPFEGPHLYFRKFDRIQKFVCERIYKINVYISDKFRYAKIGTAIIMINQDLISCYHPYFKNPKKHVA